MSWAHFLLFDLISLNQMENLLNNFRNIPTFKTCEGDIHIKESSLKDVYGNFYLFSTCGISSIESLINRIFEENKVFKNYDSLNSIEKKIDKLISIYPKLNFLKESDNDVYKHYKNFKKLKKYRNILTHFKSPFFYHTGSNYTVPLKGGGGAQKYDCYCLTKNSNDPQKLQEIDFRYKNMINYFISVKFLHNFIIHFFYKDKYDLERYLFDKNKYCFTVED